MQTPVDAKLSAAAVDRFVVQLDARACAFGTLRSGEGTIEFRIDPAEETSPLRRWTVDPSRPREFQFCADRSGAYRLELEARAAQASYRLSLQAILRRATGVRSMAAIPDSPRLRNAAADLAAFWRERASEGGPVVEALDRDHDLVTFVYRGDEHTRTVAIDWPAWTFEFAKPQLAPLANSDIWWKSIRLPHDTRMSYRFIVDPPIDPSSNRALEARALAVASQPDPLNPQRMAAGDGIPRSLLVLPGAPPETWLQRADDAPHGTLEHQRWQSAQLGNARDVAVYLPADHRPDATYPLLVLFDAESYLGTMSAPALLDSLIASGALPPLMAAFVFNATATSRNRELPCDRQFADAVASELLPFLRQRYRMTSDPKSTAVGGASYGGLAAAFIAFRHPEVFGLALSQSGSFWWSFRPGSKAFDGSTRPGWLTRQFAAREREPIRLYLSAGAFERASGGLGNLETTRALRDALLAKGYALTYREFSSGHDHLAWRADLPDGLIALFRSPPPAAVN